MFTTTNFHTYENSTLINICRVKVLFYNVIHNEQIYFQSAIPMTWQLTKFLKQIGSVVVGESMCSFWLFLTVQKEESKYREIQMQYFVISSSVMFVSLQSIGLYPPGSPVHGIFQARILEWLPFPSPRDLPDPGIKPSTPSLQAKSLPTESSGRPISQSQRNEHNKTKTDTFATIQ